LGVTCFVWMKGIDRKVGFYYSVLQSLIINSDICSNGKRSWKFFKFMIKFFVQNISS
jgi:hypothetical protein